MNPRALSGTNAMQQQPSKASNLTLATIPSVDLKRFADIDDKQGKGTAGAAESISRDLDSTDIGKVGVDANLLLFMTHN